MIALLFAASALAQAACNLDEAIVSVREHGTFEGYMCLANAEESPARITAALLETPAQPRLSRALAVWMLQRADTAFDPAHIDTLSAADRRFLADGIRARRGRKSPVPEHDKAFAQFDWYAPVATYTDGRLKPGDKEKIASLDKPRATAQIGVAHIDAAEDEAAGSAISPELAQKLVPGALVVGGILGALWYLRRPKA
ncbi:hypothetical protein LBMAG42_11160 [Deltaproteobacteria bacterium]|nr:hypothetical protein LBMAG42_11160 [Deltaproteobacteria bacterium]